MKSKLMHGIAPIEDERIRTQEQCDPPNKVDNSRVRKATLEKWKSEKEWINFEVLQKYIYI